MWTWMIISGYLLVFCREKYIIPLKSSNSQEINFLSSIHLYLLVFWREKYIIPLKSSNSQEINFLSSIHLIMPQTGPRLMSLIHTHSQLFPFTLFDLNNPLFQLIHYIFSLSLHPTKLSSRLFAFLIIIILINHTHTVDGFFLYSCVRGEFRDLVVF